MTRKGNAQLDAPSPVPPWLAKFVGDDFFSYPARLSLGSDQVNEDDIGYIARLTSLRALSLQCRCVSSRGFAPLKNLSRLEFLYLRDGFVDDEALRIVEHMPELRVLSLRYTRVTDRSVPLLAKCKRLARLSLSPTAVTRSGKEKLKRALPGCVITWKHMELNEIEQSQSGGFPCELMPRSRENWLRRYGAKHDTAAAP